MFHKLIKAFSENSFAYFYASLYHDTLKKYATNFLTEVGTPIKLKGCSFFSVVLCPHFVSYHLLHGEAVDLTLGNFSTKLPFSESSDGEKSVRRKFYLAKFLFGKNSVRRKIRSAKKISVKFPSLNIPSAKIPSAKILSAGHR